MPSSTSSFERHPPTAPWVRLFSITAAIFLSFIVSMEARLMALGYLPTIDDSATRWASERARAARLGERALILVGASRIQVDIDIDALRQETGLEPVQLAIDGSGAWAPILASLASDPAIRGTILVDYYNDVVGAHGGASTTYQNYYDSHGDGTGELQPSTRIEKALTETLHEYFSSYADGARPIFSLATRIIGNVKNKHIITIRPDRSEFVDFRFATMPDYYYKRVAATLGIKSFAPPLNAKSILEQQVASLTPEDNPQFIKAAQEIGLQVSKIKARGGRVIFVAMPSSGMVRDIEERRYPRAQFWDRFLAEVDAPGLRSMDKPSLKDFQCPDGSHLDVTDRKRFTVALARELGLGRHAEKLVKQ